MLNAQALLNQSRADTELTDLNGDEVLDALDRLVHALNEEAKLNDIGMYRAQASITNALKNRLKIEAYIRENPEVLNEKIERPIFIAGLPRTGTTALHHMMNEDSANRTIRLWEGADLVPPAETASYSTDPRIEQSRQGVQLTEQFLPGFLKTHLLDAESPDECHMFFNQTLVSVEFTSSYNIPSYTNWVYQQNFEPLYAYHKKQMQLLQFKKPGRWVMKTPLHQLGVRAILSNHPDAIVVQTHRAPMTIVASGFSFNEVVRSGNSDHIDRKVIGRDWMEMMRIYSEEFESARAEMESKHQGQFLDVYHDDFVNNPWPDLERIYSAANTSISEQGRVSMNNWLENNPKGRYGKHEYRLEDYGVTRADVESLFAGYVQRYHVAME
ncbi:MAG: sulfotransferase [Pseudomonadota bacterium]